MRKAILFGLTVPAALPLGLLWLLLGLVAGRDWSRDGLILRWELRPWAAKVWRYTTRLLYFEIGHPKHDGNYTVKVHEDTHTRQMVDYAALFFVVALLAWAAGASPWAAGGLGFFGPWLILLNYATAWLRGHHPYLGAGHEIDARANAYEVSRGQTVHDKDRKRSNYPGPL